MYEYKQNGSWLIGTISTQTEIAYFNGDKGLFDSELALIQRLTNNQLALKIEILELTNQNALIEFIIEIINPNNQRSFTLIETQGICAVIEAEKIFWINIPKEGIESEKLFKVDLNNILQNKDENKIPKKILIATHNQGKAKEFKALFEPKGIKVETLVDYPDLPVVEETGMTFEENARLKAETIADITGLPVLADDSGIMVDVLGGMPGVFSARFSGENTTDQRNNAKLLHELATQPAERRGASFHSTLALAHPKKETLIVEGNWEGSIATIPKGENGFGYDPLFLVGNTGKTAAELTAAEKNQISHRAKALQKLAEVWQEWWEMTEEE